MANKWFSECAPCHWQETHDTQDPAIVAAQQHVAEKHKEFFSLPADQASRKMAAERIGHVQLRDENTIGAGMSAGTESLAVTGDAPQSDDDLNAEEKQLTDRLLAIDNERIARAMRAKEGV